MSCARFIVLAGVFVALLAGQFAPPSAARAQDVVVVPAGAAYATYGEPSPQASQARYAGLAPFIEALSPYGTWVDLPNVGLAWKPDDSRVGATFVPYVTNGHWAASDVGWVFESDFEWGYATFHYGRWLFDGQWGWVWSPDTEWGAAWVDWRTAENHVGWAPLPPAGYAYSAGYGPSYTFVDLTYLTYVDLSTYILPTTATTYWAARSTPCNTVWSGGGQSWPAGPQVALPPRGVVHVNPPPRGVVQVRPAARGVVGVVPGGGDRITARGGSFVELSAGARIGAGPRIGAGSRSAPAWGTARVAPPAPPAPSASLAGPRARYGVQRTVFPPRYAAPPPPSVPSDRPTFAPPPAVVVQPPSFAQPVAPPPSFAQPTRPTLAQPTRPTFAQPPQPAPPQRPAFAQPVAPQRPTFAQPQPPMQPQRPAFAQPARPAFAQPQSQPGPAIQAAPFVGRPPPRVVVPPSAMGGVQVRRR